MEQMSLFENNVPQPLAARLRPRTLFDYVGQKHLLGEGKVLEKPLLLRLSPSAPRRLLSISLR